MGFFRLLRACGWALLAVALLLLGGVLVFGAVSLFQQQQFFGAVATGVFATVLLGWGVRAAGAAIRVRRTSRDPLAGLEPVPKRTDRPGFWSTLGRIQLAILFLGFGLLLTIMSAKALTEGVGLGGTLFVALLLAPLGLAGLVIGLSLLVNRGYWLWDNDLPPGTRLSRWRGSKQRW